MAENQPEYRYLCQKTWHSPNFLTKRPLANYIYGLIIMRKLHQTGGVMPDTKTYLNLRNCVENLSRNPGAEIIRYGRNRKDVLSLAQGEGDSPTPEFIMDAAQKALSEGKTFYSAVLGHDEFRQEIANYYERIYKLTLPTNRIFITGSGTTAMHIALTALLDEDDEVVAVTPIWKNLLGAIELAEARIREVALDENDGHWSLDTNKLFDAVTQKTKVILITTPSNPTGWVMESEQIREVLEFARANGIWIVSDEVYGRLTYDRPHAPSFLEFAEPDDKLFTVNSFSKAWAMTGWRLGWLVGPANADDAVRDIAIYDNMGPPNFTQYGAMEAMRHGEAFIREQLDLWQSNMDLLFERFEAIEEITAQRPQSSFYAFFRVKGKENCMDFARELIDEVGLSLAPGCSFGQVGQGYMRLCFAVSRPKLEEALDRLESAVKG